MKPLLLKLTAFLLIIAGSFTACQKPPEPDPEEPINYPIEIPFTELETQCQWTNLAYDDEVVIINSNEELKKYITCTESDYPDIDFSKHSLLLATGATDFAITEIALKELQQVAALKYNLSVDITSNPLFAGATWSRALLVEKLNDRSWIDLTINNTYLETPCDCIMDTLKGEWNWVKQYHDIAGGTEDNEFKSIVKILSQNEDASINYEVFVEDRLFYKGNFQMKDHPNYTNARLLNIRLPHWHIPVEYPWVIYFSGSPLYGSSKETIAFCMTIAGAAPSYHYQKIK